MDLPVLARLLVSAEWPRLSPLPLAWRNTGESSTHGGSAWEGGRKMRDTFAELPIANTRERYTARVTRQSCGRGGQ